MKRERHCSRHAAMLYGQSVECFDGGLLPQYDGNLSALVTQSSLPLRACLGGHGSGDRREHGAATLCGDGFGLRQIVEPERLAIGVHPYGFAQGRLNYLCGDGGGQGVVGWVCGTIHGLLRWVTAGPSFHVTSDKSTTLTTIIMNEAAA